MPISPHSQAITNLDGLDNLIEAFQRAPERLQEELQGVAEEGSERMLEALRQYPPYPGEGVYKLHGPLPGGFYSWKQRAYVLRALREGTIRVPYQRTGQLAEGWRVEIGGGAAGRIVAGFYNVTEYAHHVQDPELQARMFRGYWADALEVWIAAFPEIRGWMIEQFKAAIARVFTAVARGTWHPSRESPI